MRHRVPSDGTRIFRKSVCAAFFITGIHWCCLRGVSTVGRIHANFASLGFLCCYGVGLESSSFRHEFTCFPPVCSSFWSSSTEKLDGWPFIGLLRRSQWCWPFSCWCFSCPSVEYWSAFQTGSCSPSWPPSSWSRYALSSFSLQSSRGRRWCQFLL